MIQNYSKFEVNFDVGQTQIDWHFHFFPFYSVSFNFIRVPIV